MCPACGASQAVHTAIELRSALVARARDKLAALDCAHVDVRHGSCLDVDPSSSMRFQRIYVGAGADETVASILFGMLELGGVLVGPFATPDGSQRLLRVRRLGEGSFQVRELMHVQFTPLLAYLPAEERAAAAQAAAAQAATASHGAASPAAAPADEPSPATNGAPPSNKRSRSNSITLEPPVWSFDTHARFPADHRAAVRTLLLVHARSDSLLARYMTAGLGGSNPQRDLRMLACGL